MLAAGSTQWAQGGIAAALGPGDTPAEHERRHPGRRRRRLRRGRRPGAGDRGPGRRARADRARHQLRPRPRRRALADPRGRPPPRPDRARRRRRHRRRDPARADRRGRARRPRSRSSSTRSPSTCCSPTTAASPALTLHVMGEGQRDGVGAVHCRAVVLASGGLGQVFSQTTNPAVSTGDGMALALRAGAVLRDLEFVQFHPTVMYLGPDSRGQQPLISEAVRGEGAFLVDFEGNRVHAGRARARRPGAARRRRQGDHAADASRPAARTCGSTPATSARDVLGAPVPDDPGHLPQPRRRPGHRPDPGRARPATTPPAACAPTCGAAPTCPASTPPARSPAPACTAPTGWPPTRCSRGWSSPAGSPTVLPGELRPLAAAGARRAAPPGLVPGGAAPRAAGGDDRRGSACCAAPTGWPRRPPAARQARPASRPTSSTRQSWETTNLLTISTALADAAALREETRGSHWREDFPERDDAALRRPLRRRDGRRRDRRSRSAGAATDRRWRRMSARDDARRAAATWSRSSPTPGSTRSTSTRRSRAALGRGPARRRRRRHVERHHRRRRPRQRRSSPPARPAWSPGSASPRWSSTRSWATTVDGRPTGCPTAPGSRAGDVVMRVAGPTRGLLTAERTALNFACHLSGVATATAHWVDALEGTRARVLDTRKTLPAYRALQKYAVRCGGGVNHRFSLSDRAMVKDNHVVAAGGVVPAYEAVRAAYPDLRGRGRGHRPRPAARAARRRLHRDPARQHGLRRRWPRRSRITDGPGRRSRPPAG